MQPIVIGDLHATGNKVRKVAYTMKDDGYDAARSIPNVDELLDSDKVFAV